MPCLASKTAGVQPPRGIQAVIAQPYILLAVLACARVWPATTAESWSVMASSCLAAAALESEQGGAYGVGTVVRPFALLLRYFLISA